MRERLRTQPERQDRENRTRGLLASAARKPLVRFGVSLALLAGPVACGSSAPNAGRGEVPVSVTSIPGLTTTTIGRVEAVQPEVTAPQTPSVDVAPATDTVTADTMPASPDIDSSPTSPITTATTLFSRTDRGPVTTVADAVPTPATTPTTQSSEPEEVQTAPPVTTAPVSQTPGTVLVGGVEESVPFQFTREGGCGPVGAPVCIPSVAGYLREGPDGFPAARDCDQGGKAVALTCEAVAPATQVGPQAPSNRVAPSWQQ
ncbi:MAG TPA: hypothetical protein VLG67_02050 [Candidatus Saccharimonadales bacterium]|nr:hypothetical protein [Candidatus Saccharimonadales bacterium]